MKLLKGIQDDCSRCFFFDTTFILINYNGVGFTLKQLNIAYNATYIKHGRAQKLKTDRRLILDTCFMQTDMLIVSWPELG